MKKLLIADTTEDFLVSLTDVLRGQFDIRTCQDGKEALFLLSTFMPDVMILDLMLPEIDGITLLQMASKIGVHPVTLATVRHISQYVQDSIAGLDIGYLMKKPCSMDAILARLQDLVDRKGAQLMPVDPTELIYAHLRRLGLSVTSDGFGYLCHSFPLYLRDPEQNITKELYYAIADQFENTKPRAVEHAIRRTIHNAWSVRNESIWLEYFQAADNGHVPRPTNKSFLVQMSAYLKKKL